MTYRASAVIFSEKVVQAVIRIPCQRGLCQGSSVDCVSDPVIARVNPQVLGISTGSGPDGHLIGFITVRRTTVGWSILLTCNWIAFNELGCGMPDHSSSVGLAHGCMGSHHAMVYCSFGHGLTPSTPPRWLVVTWASLTPLIDTLAHATYAVALSSGGAFVQPWSASSCTWLLQANVGVEDSKQASLMYLNPRASHWSRRQDRTGMPPIDVWFVSLILEATSSIYV